jgi:hypothetical protein
MSAELTGENKDDRNYLLRLLTEDTSGIPQLREEYLKEYRSTSKTENQVEREKVQLLTAIAKYNKNSVNIKPDAVKLFQEIYKLFSTQLAEVQQIATTIKTNAGLFKDAASFDGTKQPANFGWLGTSNPLLQQGGPIMANYVKKVDADSRTSDDALFSDSSASNPQKPQKSEPPKLELSKPEPPKPESNEDDKKIYKEELKKELSKLGIFPKKYPKKDSPVWLLIKEKSKSWKQPIWTLQSAIVTEDNNDGTYNLTSDIQTSKPVQKMIQTALPGDDVANPRLSDIDANSDRIVANKIIYKNIRKDFLHPRWERCTETFIKDSLDRAYSNCRGFYENLNVLLGQPMYLTEYSAFFYRSSKSTKARQYATDLRYDAINSNDLTKLKKITEFVDEAIDQIEKESKTSKSVVSLQKAISAKDLDVEATVDIIPKFDINMTIQNALTALEACAKFDNTNTFFIEVDKSKKEVIALSTKYRTNTTPNILEEFKTKYFDHLSKLVHLNKLINIAQQNKMMAFNFSFFLKMKLPDEFIGKKPKVKENNDKVDKLMKDIDSKTKKVMEDFIQRLSEVKNLIDSSVDNDDLKKELYYHLINMYLDNSNYNILAVAYDMKATVIQTDVIVKFIDEHKKKIEEVLETTKFPLFKAGAYNFYSFEKLKTKVDETKREAETQFEKFQAIVNDKALNGTLTADSIQTNFSTVQLMRDYLIKYFNIYPEMLTTMEKAKIQYNYVTIVNEYLKVRKPDNLRFDLGLTDELLTIKYNQQDGDGGQPGMRMGNDGTRQPQVQTQAAAGAAAVASTISSELQATNNAITAALDAITPISVLIETNYKESLTDKSNSDIKGDLVSLKEAIEKVKTAEKANGITPTAGSIREDLTKAFRAQSKSIQALKLQIDKIIEEYQKQVPEVNKLVVTLYQNKRDGGAKTTATAASDNLSKLNDNFETIHDFLTNSRDVFELENILVSDDLTKLEQNKALHITLNQNRIALTQSLALIDKVNAIDDRMEAIKTNTSGTFSAEVKDNINALRDKVKGDKWKFMFTNYTKIEATDKDYLKVKGYLSGIVQYSNELKLARDTLNTLDAEYKGIVYEPMLPDNDPKNLTTFIENKKIELEEKEDELLLYKKKLAEIKDRIGNKQESDKTDGSLTERANPVTDYNAITDINDDKIKLDDSTIRTWAGGGSTRRGGKRFHKKTIKKNLVHKKTFKKNLLYKNQFKRKQTHKK